MKIRLSSISGHVLMTTLVIATLLGTALAACLGLVSHQHVAVDRSQRWNSAIPIIEAGIEEALTHLYYNGPDQLEANGWSFNGAAYTKQRYLGTNFFKVAITNADPTKPIVLSEGFVRLSSGNYANRRVRVDTRRQTSIHMAMVAKGQIDMSGNNIKTDSFDSADPNYSTNGQYDPAKVKSNGDVATNSELINSLNIGNANIWGRVATGPGGSIAIGPNGAVGDAAWQSSQTGIQPGWSSDDMNVTFADVEEPFTGGYNTPSKQLIGADWVDHVIDQNGNWLLSSLTKPLLVKTNIQAVLLVTDSINLTGNDYILIQKGASLKLYMKGSTANLSGNGVINLGGNATNFYYFGMTNNTSLSLGGNGEFIGVIYAPNANFSLSGGGSSYRDFIGASVTASVKMNGHFKFHYDENINRNANKPLYKITSWREL